jgi:hypothetical protein
MLTFVGDNIVYTGHAGQFAIPRPAYRVTEYRSRPILATAAGWIILALDDERNLRAYLAAQLDRAVRRPEPAAGHLHAR